MPSRSSTSSSPITTRTRVGHEAKLPGGEALRRARRALTGLAQPVQGLALELAAARLAHAE